MLMLWFLLVVLVIVAIVAISRSGKKSKVEMKKYQAEAEVLKASKPSTADEINKLKELLKDGDLTQVEFETQKAKILS